MSMIKFGPSGVPLQCDGRSSLEGVECCHNLGLEAFELQFGMGVRMKGELAKKIGKKAKELSISLSCHAPYFVNLCSTDEKKYKTSEKSLLSAGKIMKYSGGKVFVFHPGFYQKLTKEEAFSNTVDNLKKIKERFEQESVNVPFGVETVGKKAAFGGLDENIKLSQKLDFVKLVIDFAHLHARGDFKLNSKNDYYNLFSKLDKELPNYTNNMHCHFSEINYSEEKGEKNHLALNSNNTPPFRPLMEVIVENGYSGTIICETPKIDIDAIKMKEYYTSLLKK